RRRPDPLRGGPGHAAPLAPAPLPGVVSSGPARAVGAAVAALLAVLTPDQREVVLLRVVGGLPVKEVARVMDKRESAVKVLQHRALQALARHLDPAGVTRGGPAAITEVP
ncbi:MAG: RNA polymerase sigma factor, partial [Actinomycetota bacterium]